MEIFNGAGKSTRDEFIILIKGWVVRKGLNIKAYKWSKWPFFEFTYFDYCHYGK